MFSSFSDAALSAFRLWVSWIAVGGSGVGVVCAVLTVLSTREATRRSGIRADMVEAKLGEAESKLAKSEQETKEAYRIAHEARLASLPREISQEQGQKLSKLLSQIPKGTVVISADLPDTEARSYAAQIRSLIHDSGFTIVEQGYTGLISLGAPGVSIIVHDAESPPAHALTIQKCFADAGINMRIVAVDGTVFPDDAVMVWVSRKL